eukprot:jgi/Psemu1/301905/fgenesh1_kg.51_\
MVKRDERKSPENGDEDGPDYRSVAIQPLTAAPAFAGPLVPSPKLIVSAGKSSNRTNPNNEREGHGLSSSSPRWIVRELSELPAGYMLVRTNIYVRDAGPQQIAERICNGLISSSIAIDSRNAEKQNTLVVETQRGVKLVIRLFSDNGMVVVEVQRLRGCSFEFRDAAKTILRASKGLYHEPQLRPSRRFTVPATIPRRTREDRQDCVRDDFKVAYSMLHSKKSDSQILALDRIENMSKSCEAKDLAAKSVLCDYDCLSQLLSLLDECNGTDQKGMNSLHSSILRRKIFGVIANCCEAVSTSDLAEILSTSDNHLKSRSFLSFLLASMQDASAKPHDAFEAARCLRLLLVSKEVEVVLAEMSATQVIETARNDALNSHRGLEQEASKLILQL